MANNNKKKKTTIEYGKYGYFFILPFFIVYAIFQIYPLISTFYYSLFDYYKRNGDEYRSFAGLQNFANIFGITKGERGYVLEYLRNTIIMWVGNFIPQIVVSLLLAAWLTNNIVKLRGTGIYKVIIYLPSVITAASVSVLFKALFSQYGPITMTLKNWGILSSNFDFMNSVAGSRGLISFILFWMWYGNTTILLISGVLGIDPSLYEAAAIDGASGGKQFFRITLPLLKPILLYVLVTSAIGGVQLYDIPALFNTGTVGLIGGPDDKTTTMAMYIMRLYNNGDIGKAAAVCVFLFFVTLVISLLFFYTMGDKEARLEAKAEREKRKAYRQAMKGGVR
ncbi:MAG: sugar ABC transporter permease [Clostridiales bacterium]|nr:sugar ABC transporter permease [Clostridiales bacterium]